jgi:hypothetical protein
MRNCFAKAVDTKFRTACIRKHMLQAHTCTPVYKLAVLAEGKYDFMPEDTMLWKEMNKYQPVVKQRLVNRNASGFEILHQSEGKMNSGVCECSYYISDHNKLKN